MAISINKVHYTIRICFARPPLLNPCVKKVCVPNSRKSSTQEEAHCYWNCLKVKDNQHTPGGNWSECHHENRLGDSHATWLEILWNNHSVSTGSKHQFGTFVLNCNHIIPMSYILQGGHHHSPKGIPSWQSYRFNLHYTGGHNAKIPTLVHVSETGKYLNQHITAQIRKDSYL